MLWVTNLAPQPHDVYWRNLNIPYQQLWIRRITTLAGAVAFMFVFLIPVTFIQGLTQLEQLSHAFPFLRGILKKEFINQAITGYIPSVILNLFFYAVPPLMMYFSTFEGCISRSITKKSACIKVLYFTIWNDFFVNSLFGSIIRQLNVFSTVRDIPAQLARAVSTQLRKSKEVTTEEYNEFYRKYFTEYLDPLASSHFTTEGEVGFRSILYVPPVSPMGKDDVVNQKTKNIRLYVKRVFISEGFDGELFPRYLSFIKGVVDSHDLPLNVSREILQDSRIVWIMKKRLVKKAFDMILGISLSENREDYEKCRANFGKYLKLGCIDDR